MKTIHYIFLIALMSVSVSKNSAQQSITGIENITVGKTYSFWRADTANLNTGISGTNITWDFSYLQKLQGDRTGSVLLPSQTQYADTFPTATEVRQSSDGNNSFLERKNDTLFLRGFRQNFTNINIHYITPQLFAINTISYQDSYVGSSYYKYTFNNQSFRGGGFFGYEVDGYGKLILDGKTYENVLRVKIRQENSDTIKPFNSVVSQTEITNYKWYSQHNSLPLLSIDSVIVKTQGGNQKRVEILALNNSQGAVGLDEVTNTTPTALINQNAVVLESPSLPITAATVYDISGREIASVSNIKPSVNQYITLPYVPKTGQVFIIKIQTESKTHFLKLGVR